MQIDLDLSDLTRWADHLTEVSEQIPAAIARAVNRTGDMVRTAIGRELASETGLLVRDVRVEFIVARAPKKASAKKPITSFEIERLKALLLQVIKRLAKYEPDAIDLLDQVTALDPNDELPDDLQADDREEEEED
jgi:Prophage minor tail protein Z (GPZ)